MEWHRAVRKAKGSTAGGSPGDFRLAMPPGGNHCNSCRAGMPQAPSRSFPSQGRVALTSSNNTVVLWCFPQTETRCNNKIFNFESFTGGKEFCTSEADKCRQCYLPHHGNRAKTRVFLGRHIKHPENLTWPCNNMLLKALGLILTIKPVWLLSCLWKQ